jgi:homoserine/homoserine lactone efflux protein
MVGRGAIDDSKASFRPISSLFQKSQSQNRKAAEPRNVQHACQGQRTRARRAVLQAQVGPQAASEKAPWMHWTTLGAFVALELALCLIPGPAVMAVVGAALSRERSGFATALGIVTGNIAYFLISALGVASVLFASHTAFVIVRWCGAAYLAYLGVRALTAKQVDAPMPAVPDASRVARGWVSGTVTQLANPKALVFFAAILPQFIDPREPFALQVAILGFASQVVEFGTLTAYIAAAKRIGRNGTNPKTNLWAERAGGVFLIGVAAAVARESP